VEAAYRIEQPAGASLGGVIEPGRARLERADRARSRPSKNDALEERRTLGAGRWSIVDA
jgi:hypothetical protein